MFYEWFITSKYRRISIDQRIFNFMLSYKLCNVVEETKKIPRKKSKGVMKTLGNILYYQHSRKVFRKHLKTEESHVRLLIR